MDTAHLHCPAGCCTHREGYDPTHETADPEIPASADQAYDRMGAHLMVAHGVPEYEVGPLLSQTRRTITTIKGDS